eukprot:TRINITY_DN15379_c1_g1_i2.p2 TRINITY_DN15379_c1_g1~~TRINITY_DN15379_c1_g1_i2.p2  ORF type:complete len:122 (-),score=2.59 TRINITY_DN15379_c1_g1_i2:28-393(-)
MLTLKEVLKGFFFPAIFQILLEKGCKMNNQEALKICKSLRILICLAAKNQCNNISFGCNQFFDFGVFEFILKKQNQKQISIGMCGVFQLMQSEIFQRAIFVINLIAIYSIFLLFVQLLYCV